MKNLSVLALGLLVAACNGAGGGSSEPQVVTGSVSASQALANFETNKKALAEALEDEAVVRFNPCRDDITWVSTGATTGTVEFSGLVFNASNVSNIVKNSDCNYTVTPGDSNGLSSYTFTPTTFIPMTGAYTTIQVTSGGSLKLESDAGAFATPSLMISETGAHAYFQVGDSSGNNLVKSLYRRLMQTDIKNSNSYALFEVDTVNATVNFEHYNDQATSSLPGTSIGSTNFDADAIPEIASTQLSKVSMSRYQNNGTSLVDTKGGIAFIMFDRHLDADEKILMGCYALYLSTKTGNSDLWNANYQAVCNL